SLSRRERRSAFGRPLQALYRLPKSTATWPKAPSNRCDWSFQPATLLYSPCHGCSLASNAVEYRI
ncbi:MAG: hypothetical protein ACK5YO_30375, partial [Planctomyces sp.]